MHCAFLHAFREAHTISALLPPPCGTLAEVAAVISDNDSLFGLAIAIVAGSPPHRQPLQALSTWRPLVLRPLSDFTQLSGGKRIDLP
jgi:hypothetical protein